MADHDDNLPVDVSVSIAAHPLTLRPESIALGPENAVYVEARDALANTYTVLSQMTAAHKAAHDENHVRNIQLTEAARIGGYQVPGSFMGKDGKLQIPLDTNLATNLNESIHMAFVEKLGPPLDAALQRVKAQATVEADKITVALRDPRGVSSEAIEYGRDVRAHVKAIESAGERTSFLKQAIDAGNVKVVAALLGTDGFLSGIEEKTLAVMRGLAEAKFAPLATKHLAALRAIEAKIVAAGGAAIAHREKMLVPVREKQTLTLKALNTLRNNKAV